jgi:copper resistance protein B
MTAHPTCRRRRGVAPAVRTAAWLVVLLASPAGAQQHQHPAPPAQGGHEGHAQPAPASPAPPPAPASPSSAPAPLPPFIPPITDADRAAAFPDVDGHMSHGGGVRAYVLVDELEWRTGGGASGSHWDVDGWVGGDRDRLWFRAEGVGDGDPSGPRFQELHGHLLWGRPLSRWWTGVAGLRVDGRPGDPQAWAAFGLQGIAPYRVHLEVTGYVGGGGRTQLRADAAHDLRLTRRLVAQTRLEATLAGKSDDVRGIGKGLTATEVGVRVRYEIRRDLAPYVGVTWHRTYGDTAAHERAHGGSAASGRIVFGLRVWR